MATERGDAPPKIKSIDDLPPIITPQELAAFMRTKENCLTQDRYLGRGVPFVKHGRKVLYTKADVIAYLAQNTRTRTDDIRAAQGVATA